MKKVPYFHILLFIVTCITTLAAGALQRGSNIFESPLKLLDGLPFAGTLMVLLTVHELAHYLTSRRHHVSATLPYFIPAPSLIGTFGAFIKMTSPIITRRALIDIGIRFLWCHRVIWMGRMGTLGIVDAFSRDQTPAGVLLGNAA